MAPSSANPSVEMTVEMNLVFQKMNAVGRVGNGDYALKTALCDDPFTVIIPKRIEFAIDVLVDQAAVKQESSKIVEVC